jgi:hypothetical protein
VSIRAVAFVPSAPLLVPSVGSGSGEQDDILRAATVEAVTSLASAAPEVIVVVAPVAAAGTWDEQVGYSFDGFGVPRDRSLMDHSSMGGTALPWQLGIGAWLLDESGWTGARRYLGIDRPRPTDLHRQLIEEVEAGVVVVADGSARRSERAPGYFDARAEPFDVQIAAALAGGRPDELAAIDSDLAAELMCGGWPAWAWLAAMVEGAAVSPVGTATHVAPYGVGYFVAEWSVG